MKNRGECQICAREISLNRDGTLSIHGYQRPGTGQLEGRCYGTRWQPYPATDGLVSYLEMLNGLLAGAKQALSLLPTRPSLTYVYRKGFGRRAEEVTVLVKVGDIRRQGENGATIPSFVELQFFETQRLGHRIAQLQFDIDVATLRIQNAGQ